MRTGTFESAPILSIRCFALLLLLTMTGCFTAPTPDLGKLKCTTDQQCPSGYSCLAPNQVGGCCKPGTPCPATMTIDASNPDLSPVDLRIASEAQPMGIDMGTGGTGGLIALDGAATGGAGGAPQLDANVSDSPADTPARDVAMEGSTVDVSADAPMDAPIDSPGTCSADMDCPSATPLCLANKCAKCTTDTDCVGRTGPACQASSGLCVGCTANKYCTGAAATCNTATNQCTGCVTRSDCSGACLTCASGVCTSVKNQDDPGVCAGTCDATGACKAKKGQTCQASTDCAGGLPCADGYCCDSACTGSCQACNVAAALGTCTTLAANGAPHPGHSPCTGTDVCVGKCSGTNPDCTFPPVSTACGTASCSSSNVYQGAGTCNAGACTLPSAKTCPNGCVVSSGGCTECKPSATGCSSTNVPQLCDATGTWQNQTACLTGFACTSGSCTCTTPGKTNCTTACTDLLSDPKNCGTCGHDCLGGACSGGKCQPIAITNPLATTPYLLGIDSNYLYYSQESTTLSPAVDVYRVGKSASLVSGSPVYTTPQTWVIYRGIIGSTLFLTYAGDTTLYGYTIGSASAASTLAASNSMATWGTMTPTNYTLITTDNTTNLTFQWYNPNNSSLVATYSQSLIGVAPSGGAISFGPFAAGDSLYWIRTVKDSSLNPLSSSGLYVTSSSNASTQTQLAGGSVLDSSMYIADVNATSLILCDTYSSPNYFYRVLLPSGNGTASPTVIPTGGGVTCGATEDANGLYWADDSGNIKRCVPANCAGTAIVLASGQSGIQGFYYDNTALYWSVSSPSPNLIMRLAK